jgi:amino acid adenylation domain-containing protein
MTAQEASVFPVSYAQQRLWLLDQLQPASPLYNVFASLPPPEPLLVSVLAQCLGEIVRRHESLRTTFTEVDGYPVQVIRRSRRQAVPVVDLSGLPAPVRPVESRRLAERQSLQPFDLASGPLLRATLVRRGSGDHRLLLALHHIITDAWSMEVLLRELQVLYAAFAAGEPSPLPELPIQYADYAVWQRRWLCGPVLAAELGFWRQQLAGAPPLLQLPADRPRPPLRNPAGAYQMAVLPQPLAVGLRALSLARGATLFMTLLAAFQVLLARWSGQSQVVVGSPIANRTRGETEGLIGFFVNTLVLRTDLAGDPTFERLVDRVREVALAAYAHQDLPFEKLVAELEPERDLSRTPVFQVLFVLQNTPGAGIEDPDPHDRRVEPTTAKFDLSLSMEEGAEGLAALAEYSTDLFDHATISRLLDHLAVLLAGVAAEPGRPITRLPLLSAAERQQLLGEWNDTACDPDSGLCLHQLFEAQACRRPEAVALTWAHERLSYAELDRRASRLAERLRELGVGPETRVAVAAGRSPDMVVGLLASLKAEGAYVALDPAYPALRLQFMLEDSEAAVLLTERRLLALLPAATPPTLCLGEPAGDGDGPAQLRALGGGLVPANLAYLIYTSGSTGRPKGVAIDHGGAVAFLGWCRRAFPPEQLAGVLAATSICFDLSVFELFAPLAHGGAVILARDALEFPELPAAAVTLVNTVPSALAEVLRSGGLLSSLRAVNLAGEPLPAALAEELFARAPALELNNLYGPSEATTYATWARVPRRARVPPPIGRPISQARALVLDRRGEPVAAGVVGSLLLGGPGLARCYFRRPRRTAERFVPDRFGRQAGGRLFDTGDRVRLRPDGQLEFLGRGDHQVKVRGFRIELGEIEATLCGHPAVGEALVEVRPLASGEPGLVAWLAAGSGTAAAGVEAVVEAVRAHARERLPSYMVPPLLLPLAELPRGPNGKVARDRLPQPVPPRRVAPLAPPRGELERRIARVFCEVLGLPAVGGDDNFFDLGAHSLVLVRVAGSLRRLLGTPVAPLDLFRYPTLKSLARHLAAGAAPTPSPARSRERARQKRRSLARQRELARRRAQPAP